MRWRTILPFLISAALISWLVWHISPQNLLQAASELNWSLLVPATALMVIILYLWDAVCLRTLYSTDALRLKWSHALHLRGSSYLAGAIHYELGQALLAVEVASLHGASLVWALSRIVLLAYHDLLVLLSLGLWGSLLSADPLASKIRALCSIGLVVLLVIGLVPLILRPEQRQRLRQTRWGAWFGSWSLRRSACLAAQRAIYFGILVLYAAVALTICDIYPSHTKVLSTVPLVLVADGFPSVAGLGTRETALLLLMGSEDNKSTLLAMSLIWSVGMIVVRVVIGLTHLWVPVLQMRCASRHSF